VLEKELGNIDQYYQKEISALSQKNETLESDIKKMIEIQLAFKQKNSELFERNKMFEKQIQAYEKNAKRDAKTKDNHGLGQHFNEIDPRSNNQANIERENNLIKQIQGLQKENDLLKVLYIDTYKLASINQKSSKSN
jgi:hypothetical protein